MGKNSDWYLSKNLRDNKKLNTMIADYPYFARSYIINKQSQITIETLISYTYTINSFFDFLLKTKGNDTIQTIQDITIEMLNTVTKQDIIGYREYLQQESGSSNINGFDNSSETIARKFSILKGLYEYMESEGWIQTNPFRIFKTPKTKNYKEIEHLSIEEIHNLFDNVLNLGNCRSSHQAAYLKKTQLRDYTILLLLLNTGIKVSECQGLDIQDIDLQNNRIAVVRNKNQQSYIYLNLQVCHVLHEYLIYRKLIQTKFPDEKALFLSVRRTRISVRAIQKLVSKMAPADIQEKSVTPTTLRNTYGVELYRETNDAQLVSSVLGCPSNIVKYTTPIIPDKRNAANAILLSEMITDKDPTLVDKQDFVKES